MPRGLEPEADLVPCRGIHMGLGPEADPLSVRFRAKPTKVSCNYCLINDRF